MDDPSKRNPKIKSVTSLESTDLGRAHSNEMIPPNHIPKFSGAVLAGGRSRRMGRDKALLSVAGEPLLVRQTRLLVEAGAAEVLISQSSDRPGRNWPHLPHTHTQTRTVWDLPGDLGPLAGLGAVLQAAQSDRVLVVAVDLPSLSVVFLQELVSASSSTAGVVCRTHHGWEPFLTVYPSFALTAIKSAIARHELACQSLIQQGIAEGWLVEFRPKGGSLIPFTNWNYPEDLPERP